MIVFNEDGQGTDLSDNGSDDVSGAASAPKYNQPEYGQRVDPDYGQMENQYPNWDPYVYGRPDPPDLASQQAEAGQLGQQQSQQAPYSQGNLNSNASNARTPFSFNPLAGGSTGQNPQNSQPEGSQPQGQPGAFFFQGQPVDLDDPAKNPVYGRTDPFAVIGFILSLVGGLFFFAWVISIPMCISSFRRIPKFRMRGRGWAIAGIVVALLGILFEVLIAFGGLNTADLFGFLPNGSGVGSGTGGETSGPSVDA